MNIADYSFLCFLLPFFITGILSLFTGYILGKGKNTKSATSEELNLWKNKAKDLEYESDQHKKNLEDQKAFNNTLAMENSDLKNKITLLERDLDSYKSNMSNQLEAQKIASNQEIIALKNQIKEIQTPSTAKDESQNAFVANLEQGNPVLEVESFEQIPTEKPIAEMVINKKEEQIEANLELSLVDSSEVKPDEQQEPQIISKEFSVSNPSEMLSVSGDSSSKVQENTNEDVIDSKYDSENTSNEVKLEESQEEILDSSVQSLGAIASTNETTKSDKKAELEQIIPNARYSILDEEKLEEKAKKQSKKEKSSIDKKQDKKKSKKSTEEKKKNEKSDNEKSEILDVEYSDQVNLVLENSEIEKSEKDIKDKKDKKSKKENSKKDKKDKKKDKKTESSEDFLDESTGNKDISSQDKVFSPEYNLEELHLIFGKKASINDLKIIEGIGPKIESVFFDSGILTWEDLANITPEKCLEILQNAGSNFQMHNPSTWPKQAELAFLGKFKRLKNWQKDLDGGVEWLHSLEKIKQKINFTPNTKIELVGKNQTLTAKKVDGGYQIDVPAELVDRKTEVNYGALKITF